MNDKLFLHILVGIDSAGMATNAVLQGAGLARELGASLDLVHAVEVPHSLLPGLSGEDLGKLQASAVEHGRRQVLESLAEAVRGTPLAPRVGEHLLVHAGHPARVILERASEVRADLIVLGHHARRPLFDFGSTARAVLARTEAPVWIQPGPIEPIRRILVPTDLSEHSRRALEQARGLAERLGAAICLMHCFEPPAFGYADGAPGPTYVIDEQREAAQQELGRWMRELEPWAVPVEAHFAEGESAPEILRAAEGADLIAMGTHGRTGLARFLIGSVAYAVLKQSAVPVLVVPSPERSYQLTAAEAAEVPRRTPERVRAEPSLGLPAS